MFNSIYNQLYVRAKYAFAKRRELLTRIELRQECQDEICETSGVECDIALCGKLILLSGG